MTPDERTLGLAAFTGFASVLLGAASTVALLLVAAAPPLGATALEKGWTLVILLLTVLTVVASFRSLAQIVLRRPLRTAWARAEPRARPVLKGWLLWTALATAAALALAGAAGVAAALDTDTRPFTLSPAFADVPLQLTIASSITMCISFDLLSRWWRDARRTLRGECAACGYSLAGLPDGAACPECGTRGPRSRWRRVPYP